MKLIWTKGNNILSRAIRWSLNEPVSHFAIVFDDKVVFHSNLKGTHLEWLGSFTKNSEIVLEKEYHLTLEQEESIYQEIVTRYDNAGYDFKSFWFFTKSALKYKLFNIPLPKNNPHNDSKTFICTELGNLFIKDNIDLSITSPQSLYNIIDKNGIWQNLKQ